MQLSDSENRIVQSKAVIGWNCLKAICACAFSSSKILPEKQKLDSKDPFLYELLKRKWRQNQELSPLPNIP